MSERGKKIRRNVAWTTIYVVVIGTMFWLCDRAAEAEANEPPPTRLTPDELPPSELYPHFPSW